MAFNPHRSWAVTYNQMWNLSMRDPIPKNTGSNKQTSSGGFNNYSFHRGNHSNNNNSVNAGSKERTKPDYCWNFNKDIPCRFGKKCMFIERCSYCDSPSHPVINCAKLKQKKNKAKAGKIGKAG